MKFIQIVDGTESKDYYLSTISSIVNPLLYVGLTKRRQPNLPPKQIFIFFAEFQIMIEFFLF